MVYMRTFLLDKMEYTFFHFQIYELDSVSVTLSQHNQKEVFALWLIPFICTLEIFPIHIMYFLFSFTKREESKQWRSQELLVGGAKLNVTKFLKFFIYLFFF